MVWQKSFTTDTIPFQKVKNRGQKFQYFAEDCHEPIISKEDFQAVQELTRARQENISPSRFGGASLYSRKIVCGECDALCRRKIIRGKTYWMCAKHDSGKEQCPVTEISETALNDAVLRCYHKLKRNRETLLMPLLKNLKALRELELRSNRKLNDVDNEIARLSEQNLVLTRLQSKGAVDPALVLSQRDEMNHKLLELRKLRRNILETAGGDRQVQTTEDILEYLEESPDWLHEVDSELFDSLFQKILLLPNGEIKLQLLNGLELTERTVG